MTQEVKEKRPDTSLHAVAKSFSVKTGTPLSPFICSTIDDFQDEHRILHEKVFPQLAELCLLRKTHFSPVDLGWNRSLKGQENSSGVLRLSLDYVTKCAPFFLCLLGERYGSFRDPTQPQLSCYSALVDSEEEEEKERQSSLDRNLLAIDVMYQATLHKEVTRYKFAASSGYKWVLNDTYQYSSITELMIRHAVFSADGSPASASQHFSFFYFRQPDHLELLESRLGYRSPDERSRELALYESESELAASYIEELKLNIVKKGLSVQYFSTAEQLATFVLDDWKSVIEFLYPPVDSFDWFSEETELNIFSATCRKLFVHTNKLDVILKKLADFALDRIVNFKSTGNCVAKKTIKCLYKTASEKIHGEDSLLLLVGSRGCGKSSLLATFAESFRCTSPPVKIFEHYAGCTESSTSATSMMRRCIARLRSTKHHMPGTDYGLNVEDPGEYNRVREEFHAVIRSQGCVLVLDNIDGLYRCKDTSDQMVKDPKWLPFPLPSTVTVIASCTKTDLAYHSLVDRSGVRVISLPDVEDVRSRQAMLVRNSELNGKTLNRGKYQELVIEGCLAGRPLYLALLGGEMRAFVDSERMLNCLRCCSEAPSVCDLWGHIMRRWMDEYSWGADGRTNAEYSGWVPDTLRLISTSRNGLLQSELQAILSEFGFTGPRTISSFDWLRFRLAASNVLVQASTGLIRFMHNHVREASDFVLFGSVTPLSGYRKVEKTPAFEDSGSGVECRSTSKLIYHRHIANYFLKQPFGVRQADELPWQCNKLQDYGMLAELLSDHRMVMEMYGKGSKSHRAGEILGYWKTLLKAGFNPGPMYKDELSRIYSEYAAVKHTNQLDPKMKPSCFTQDYCKLCICVGQLLMQLGSREDAREVLMHGILHLNKMMPLSKAQLTLLSRLQTLIGGVVARCCDGQPEVAVRWYEQAVATIEGLLNNVLWDKQRRNMLEAKGCLLVCLGNVKTEEGDFTQAEALFNSARRCMAKNVLGRALVLYSVGLLQMFRKEFDQSEESLRSALRTLESYHGRSHPTVARIYSELGTLAAHAENSAGFNISKAEGFYRTAIKLNEECLGSCHVLVANDLFSLGILLWSKGKDSQKEEAHEMIKRAFDMCTLKLGDDHSLTRKIRAALTGQEIQMTLQSQALQENATLSQKQNLLPNAGKKSNVHFRQQQQMSLRKNSVKSIQLPSNRGFSESLPQSSVSEIQESLDIDTKTAHPKHGARHFQDNESVSVEFSQDLYEQTRHTSEKLKMWSAHTHPGSAQTYHTYRAAKAKQRHKAPADDTCVDGIQNSTQKHCTLTAMHKHISCFEYNENFPRSITSGPSATVDSLLNKKQFSLPTPGSLH